jgi:hypothetical protein
MARGTARTPLRAGLLFDNPGWTATLWIMTLIRIDTVDAPLNGRNLLAPAIGLVRRAMALGLLGDREVIGRLDLDLIRGIAREASSAGVGHDAAMAILENGNRPARLATLIRRLDDALAESPLPDRELRELLRIFTADDLAALLGISSVSLRRYATGARSMPDVLAARTHELALLVSDLGGAYNEIGIRRWFDRPRAQLDGQTPRQALGPDWDPAGEATERVRALAGALAGAGPAT